MNVEETDGQSLPNVSFHYELYVTPYAFRLLGNLTIFLDKRVLKTPEGRRISLPSSKRVLASLIAQEWESQDKVVKHHALPLVGLIYCFRGQLSSLAYLYDDRLR